MKRFCYGFVFVLFILLVGCKNVSKDTQIKFITEQVEEISLTPNILPIDMLNPTGIVAIDTFLIFVQRHEEKMIKVFNSNDYQFLGDFLRKGNGPDEILLFSRFNQFRVMDGEVQLWIQSYPNYIGLLNVNKSIEDEKTVFDRKYAFTSSMNKSFLAESNAVFNLNDSVFLLTKDPIRSQTFENNTNPFYVKLNYNTNELSDTIYINNFKKIEMKDIMIYSAYPAIKPDLEKVVLFATYMDVITIIDLKSGGKIKIGASDEALDYRLGIANKFQVHYESFATDSLIFGLRKNEKSNSIIYALDWNGNLKYKINLNANVLFFSINEKNKKMYCIDIEDRILIYDLKEVLGDYRY